MSFETLLGIALVALVTGVVSCVSNWLRWRAAGPPDAAPTPLGYFGLAALLAFGAYLAGNGVGIALACASPRAGNLCGLWGALGAGPLAAGLALALYGPLRRARAARSGR